MWTTTDPSAGVDFSTTGAAGAAGAVLGYFAGRGRSPAPAPAPQPSPDPTPLTGPLANYKWTLTIWGGYAWWFRTASGRTTVRLMTLDETKCTCSNTAERIEHAMKLIVHPRDVEVVAGTTFQPTTVDQHYEWNLTNQTRFIRGMQSNGIQFDSGTTWEELRDPYGPSDPNDVTQWDDTVWLPERLKAKSDPHSLAAAYLDLTDGVLRVSPPRNAQAKSGRWVFTINMVKKRKALTDILALSGRMADVLGIETGGGRILLKPTGTTLPMSIRHAVKLRTMPFGEGEELPHFRRLYDFVDQAACNDAIVPVFEKRPDVSAAPPPMNDHPEPRTPGDLCPPVFLF